VSKGTKTKITARTQQKDTIQNLKLSCVRVLTYWLNMVHIWSTRCHTTTLILYVNATYTMLEGSNKITEKWAWISHQMIMSARSNELIVVNRWHRYSFIFNKSRQTQHRNKTRVCVHTRENVQTLGSETLTLVLNLPNLDVRTFKMAEFNISQHS